MAAEPRPPRRGSPVIAGLGPMRAMMLSMRRAIRHIPMRRRIRCRGREGDRVRGVADCGIHRVGLHQILAIFHCRGASGGGCDSDILIDGVRPSGIIYLEHGGLHHLGIRGGLPGCHRIPALQMRPKRRLSGIVGHHLFVFGEHTAQAQLIRGFEGEAVHDDADSLGIGDGGGVGSRPEFAIGDGFDARSAKLHAVLILRK